MKTFTTTIISLLAISTFSLTTARADQPHMRAALANLRAARAQLQSAEHNKGGWRVRALANVDRAIADTEGGIAAGR